MQRQDFYYELPEALIAQRPLQQRTDSRLLVYQAGTSHYHHQKFPDIMEWLNEGDLLVMNNSRVIPARLYGQKSTGGKLECLVERIISPTICLMQIRASKSLKSGHVFTIADHIKVQVLDKKEDLYHCEFDADILTVLNQYGHIPLPPYIKRHDDDADLLRYQTVYAKPPGSVAAPTAGLHFDEALLAKLKDKGIKFATTTLHVGAGTFQPVRVDSLRDHQMHSEAIEVSEALCQAVQATQQAGGRIICVGTTSLRALESASQSGSLQPYQGETDIFIYPGYEFKTCDGLITNFHLPESTLLMLVSAFIGYQQAMDLYRVAVENQYRFFSYGDASLLLKK